jgi:hypothetical protein
MPSRYSALSCCLCSISCALLRIIRLCHFRLPRVSRMFCRAPHSRINIDRSCLFQLYFTVTFTSTRLGSPIDFDIYNPTGHRTSSLKTTTGLQLPFETYENTPAIIVSALSVLCRATYEVASPDDCLDKVRLNVCLGDDMKTFNVPVILLCKGSKYFDKR